MKKIVGILLVILGYGTAIAGAQGLPDFTGLVDANSRSVVNISTTRRPAQNLQNQLELPDDPNNPLGQFLRRFLGDDVERYLNQETHSLGSGFIISADGYIVTNNHVVREADEIIVRFSDKTELEAKVVGTDARTDIALLKVEAKNLPVVKLGDANKLKVGEWVLAIGSPFGFEYSVTAGIVSAKGRSLPNENYVPFIQTDVAINPGNSGGPLFNLNGQVVGVNSQIYSRTGGFMGLSFAIPMDVAMNVVEQIKQKGHVSRGWLGVLIQEITRDLAQSFGMSKPYGALIAKIVEGSPAANSDIKVGDVIVEFNGTEIKDSKTLPPLVAKVHVGDTASVKVLRDGKSRVLSIKIGELPEEGGAAPESLEKKAKDRSRLGIMLQDLNEEQKKEYHIDQGVVIVDVKSGPAREAGLQRGDIIMRFNNQPVKGVEDLIQKIDAQKPGSSVALFVQRQQGPLFLALRIPEEK